MGYCIDIVDTSFAIEAVHYPDLMDHLIKFHTKAKAQNVQFKWCDHDKCLAALNEGDLIAFFAEWNYEVKIELSTGNISDITSMAEKLADEDKLWVQIAPWVNAGSYIQCHGEDGDQWRWVWDNGRLFHVEATLHFDDPVDCGYRHNDAEICGDELDEARSALGIDTPKTQVSQLIDGVVEQVNTQYALNALRTQGPR
jgi:hypothetical protein